MSFSAASGRHIYTYKRVYAFRFEISELWPGLSISIIVLVYEFKYRKIWVKIKKCTISVAMRRYATGNLFECSCSKENCSNAVVQRKIVRMQLVEWKVVVLCTLFKFCSFIVSYKIQYFKFMKM